MRRRLQFVVVAAALSTSLIAQTKPSPSPAPSPSSAAKPNFSGTWLFDSGSNGRGANGRGGAQLQAFFLGREFTATQDDTTLTIVTNPASGEPKKLIHQLDGTITSDSIGEFRLAWDGGKLVISISEVGRPPRTQVWTLDATGARLVVETQLHLSGAARPAVTMSTYLKK